MRNGTIAICAALCVLGLSLYAAAARERVDIPATATNANKTTSGISAVALSTSPKTTHLRADMYTQATVYSTMSAGTTTSVVINCDISPDGTNWYPYPDAISSGSGGYTVYDRADTITVVSGTVDHLPPLYFVLNSAEFRCTYSGAGTSTVTARVYLSEM